MEAAERRLLTAEEFSELPDTVERQELVEGRVVSEPPDGLVHGFSVSRLCALLVPAGKSAGTVVVVTNVGFILARDPDTVRAPDVAVIRRERLRERAIPRGYFTGAPDIAIEVLSPSNRPGEIRGKAAEYLESGSALVWVIDPGTRRATSYRHLLRPVSLGPGDALDGEDVLPGFRLTLESLFEE